MRWRRPSRAENVADKAAASMATRRFILMFKIHVLRKTDYVGADVNMHITPHPAEISYAPLLMRL